MNLNVAFEDDHEINVDYSTKFQSYGSGSLLVNDLQLADSGRYTCLALNEFGNTTAAAYLGVEGMHQFPFLPTKLQLHYVFAHATLYSLSSYLEHLPLSKLLH